MKIDLTRPNAFLDAGLAALLLNGIEDYLLRHELTGGAFGRRATGNEHLVTRLRAGRPIRNRTAAKLIQYIRRTPNPKPMRQKPATAATGWRARIAADMHRDIRSNPVQPNIPDDQLPPRVDRDPCPRCAVRADIGCRHRVAPWHPGDAA